MHAGLVGRRTERLRIVDRRTNDREADRHRLPVVAVELTPGASTNNL
jgi:hypothetical protein